MPERKHAYYFAAGAHAAVNQNRKYTKTPYIDHPVAVLGILDNHIKVSDAVACAALLHDVVEDTKTTIETIEKEFGQEVANLVGELTDISTLADGNRAARKKIDREHSARACEDAQNIKVADLMDNTHTIVIHDPKFARIYLPEKRLLLDVLTKADQSIRAAAYRQLKHSEDFLRLSEKDYA